jgi:DNA adenine methylase
MNITKIERIHSYSPLRYPGGKTGLLGLFRKMIRANSMREVTYVEPYAGGAGAALGLLISGEVENIVINDLDPAIAAFWRSVVSENRDFTELVKTTPLTIEEWHRQKDICRQYKGKADLEVGFATFYLNRTNRSGVLNAGPIGGMDQKGNYKIDARFNRDSLSERIRLIGIYGSRIEVRSQDGLKTAKDFVGQSNSLVYVDPPYFVKGSSLYLNSFDASQHRALASQLNAASNGNWVLTYDDVPQVREYYPARRRIEFALNYSVHTAKKAQEVMVFSDALVAPNSEGSWLNMTRAHTRTHKET